MERAARIVLKSALWLAFLWWVAVWLANPTRRGHHADQQLKHLLTSPTFGTSGSWLLIYWGPLLAIVVLGALYLQLTKNDEPKRMVSAAGRPRVSLWNYPAVVGGPLGIVSAAELLALSLFLVFLVWIICWSLPVGWGAIDLAYWSALASREGKAPFTLWQVRLNFAACFVGIVGFAAMSLLFLPVSRGSVLLRLVNIPFEHAVKYHKWVGVITMGLFLAHGFLYIAYFTSRKELWSQLTEWPEHGISHLAGVIALVVGVIMSLTSIPQVRARFFELFFFTHQLYLLFVVFALMHVGEGPFQLVMAGVFLFALDRFLRFIQSKKSVGLLSVRHLPGDTTQLVFAKHPSLGYSPASFILVHVPALSRWQWHPFTIASSSLVEPDCISILVKRQGKWTKGLEKLCGEAVPPPGKNLKASAGDETVSSCPFSSGTAVEGPYGHESTYFLRYESLILVAGGSGVAPFISILKDLQHRHENAATDEQGGCSDLPTDVTFIWAVRRAEELRILDCMAFPLRLDRKRAPNLQLQLQAYVTRESAPDLERAGHQQQSSAVRVFSTPTASLHPLCPEVGRDSNWGTLAVVLASVVGYLVVWGLLGRYHLHLQYYFDYPTWATALFSLLAVLLGITVFGGSTALIWTFFVAPQLYRPQPVEATINSSAGTAAINNQPHTTLITADNTHYGSRPNLQEIFASSAKKLAGRDVGVLVCGPEGMHQVVAQLCQDHSSLFGASVAFHYHGISFEL